MNGSHRLSMGSISLPTPSLIGLSDPNPWFILPFILLLLGIALGPFLNRHWWETHYPKVAFGLGALVVAYYLGGLGDFHRPTETLTEYISFICLIGSLFVVSGGIHIRLKGEATPLTNVLFLLLGAVIANIIGTTGASMLLIRPWIRMNKYRITAFHIVFFIFVVSNCGGCLTPVGDPPLFLGYLKGVPFWWVLEKGWPSWLLVIGLLLASFYVVDHGNFRRAPKAIRDKETHNATWGFDGLPNLFFLAVILGAIFVKNPPFLREALMLLAALGSYFSTRREVHEKNDFSFAPIKEVAILFAGIFATMMPALDFLQLHARQLGLESSLGFYWGSGSLSSVLDNAPTYLSFLYAQFGLFISPDTLNQLQALIATHGPQAVLQTGLAPDIQATLASLQLHQAGLLALHEVPADLIKVSYIMANHSQHLLAVSLGSVFYGAMTYIGNGPNLMVKSIADHSKVNTPLFLEYVFRYSLPILLPILALAGWIAVGR